MPAGRLLLQPLAAMALLQPNLQQLLQPPQPLQPQHLLPSQQLLQQPLQQPQPKSLTLLTRSLTSTKQC